MTPRKKALPGTPVRRSERIRLLQEAARLQAEQALQEDPEPQAAGRRRRAAPGRARAGGVRRRTARRRRLSGHVDAFAHFERFMVDILHVARECFTGQEHRPLPLARTPPPQDNFLDEVVEGVLEQEQEPELLEPDNTEDLDILVTVYTSSEDES